MALKIGYEVSRDVVQNEQKRKKVKATYALPKAKIHHTATFCFLAICKPHSVTTGMMINTPSVLMFKIACASAILLRQVVVPGCSGLHGTESTIVNTRVYTVQVNAMA